MGRATTRIPMSRRVLSSCYDNGKEVNWGAGQPDMQLSGSIFGFLEEEVTMSSSEESDFYRENDRDVEDEEESENPENVEDNIKFWETQHQNLHTTLYRTTTLESKIRDITKEVLGEMEAAENVCSCSRPVSGGCRSCRMSQICGRLQNSGFNSAVCKSKWRSSSEIPSGEHTFLDVIDNSSSKKGEVRVIIELDFRGQFELKKGNEEYNQLVSKLPNVFIGKIERLLTIIKILSAAAKKCMKEKKMHLGPWRKQRYMQAKWVRVVERNTRSSLIKPVAIDSYCNRPARTKASMLTVDLLDNLSNLYTKAVEVL